jgi:hypothetical protein
MDGASARYVHLTNIGSSSFDVYVTCISDGSGRTKLRTINPHHAIKWRVPAGLWKGDFRVGPGLNATLAVFSFNDAAEDSYYISTVPPGAPKMSPSYAASLRHTSRTGFNVPVKISLADSNVSTPATSTSTSTATAACSRPGDRRSAGFPNDVSAKTRRCASEGQSYLVEFGVATVSNYGST